MYKGATVSSSSMSEGLVDPVCSLVNPGWAPVSMLGALFTILLVVLVGVVGGGGGGLWWGLWGLVKVDNFINIHKFTYFLCSYVDLMKVLKKYCLDDDGRFY